MKALRGICFGLGAVLALVAGCGSDDSRDRVTGLGAAADVPLLFMGNSHSSLNGLQDMVVDIVAAGTANETVGAVEAPGWMFLEDRYRHEPSLDLLASQSWDFVVLQAQKYSTSHTINYSIDEAVALVGMARAQSAVPILFPEWPLEGVDETMYIYDIHVSIAEQAAACIAPVGQAWDLALSRHPGIDLYAADGNHSNRKGAFLTALILAATMTGASPLDAPAVSGIDATTQAQLRAVAADTVAAWPPRQYCPDDPY